MRPRGKQVYVIVGICHKKVIVERLTFESITDRFTGLAVADVMRGGWWILGPEEVALKRGVTLEMRSVPICDHRDPRRIGKGLRRV